ncbi:hypothetical protein B9Z55_020965 [Caenorhabditis nigoni]|uniref:Smr domain-containing protein n=1 Tax=Caenorhabditis nigoni TaxID=1611254 RepID=A0A2G5TQI9_9PELO|nr:hypothetical protein B9Z55_020965 [Caenorhabditis nigoni]
MPLTKYEKQHQQRMVGAVKKASGIQDTLAINEALADNGNDAKKVCDNFGVIRMKLKRGPKEETKVKLEKELLQEARSYNERRNSHDRFDLHCLTVNLAVIYAKELIEEARKKGLRTIFLVTGAGNNSPNGVCNTKRAIMWEIKWNMPQCRVTEDPSNQGMLIVEL